VKCCGDVEKFCVKPQLLLTALLCRKQIDAYGVIKEQIAGILTQDLCGLFCEKRIGNVEGGREIGHALASCEINSTVTAAGGAIRGGAEVRSGRRLVLSLFFALISSPVPDLPML
jgi:hypothetical protein